MSVDLVVSGMAGTAARTAPRDRVGLFGTVVDEWTVTPDAGGEPVHVAAIDPVTRFVVTDRLDMVLVVLRVDPALLATARRLGVPETVAADVAVLVELPATDYTHARQVTRHLVRAAVDGTLPMPSGPADARLWAVAADALCRVTAGQSDAPTEPVGRSTVSL